MGESGKVGNFNDRGRPDNLGESGKSDPSGEPDGLHNLGKHDDPVKRSRHDSLDNIGEHARPDAIGQREQVVYSLIADREREAASPDCRKKSVRVRVVCGGISFAMRQVRVVGPGWREVSNRASDAEQDEVSADAEPMPVFKTEETVSVDGCNLAELTPRPKPLFTEATLLEAMANVEQALPEVALPEAGAPSQAEGTKDAIPVAAKDAAAATDATTLFDAMPEDAQLDTPASSTTTVPPQQVRAILSEVGVPLQVVETKSAVPTAAASGNDRIHTYGIGAPSSRASIIETLIAHEYIERSGDDIASGLIPTERGLHLWEAVRTMLIADVGMAVHWERQLALIGSGELSPEAFHEEIAGHVRRMTAEILAISTPEGAWGCFPCPKCKSGKVVLRTRSARCNNPCCGLAIYRTIRGVRLTDSHIEQLIRSGSTGLIHGFAGAKGRKFGAAIVHDEKFNLKFEYPEMGKRGKK
ncbi:MAG: topoisomerase C-terminal repeat-containing protein [Rikenellaceae bacterium]|nr:topoisomerase C-terminal repeat-containing protein [Rikenellaceae bacterium]